MSNKEKEKAVNVECFGYILSKMIQACEGGSRRPSYKTGTKMRDSHRQQ